MLFLTMPEYIVQCHQIQNDICSWFCSDYICLGYVDNIIQWSMEYIQLSQMTPQYACTICKTNNDIDRNARQLFTGIGTDADWPCTTNEPNNIKSLWPSDAFWRHRSMSTMALVMACCLTAPSHYMNQCWLIISQVLWYSPKSNFIGIAEDINLGNKPDNYTYKIILASARGQWVNQYHRILARHEDVAYKYILNSMHCVSGHDYF